MKRVRFDRETSKKDDPEHLDDLPDCYRILRLDPSASLEEVKESYDYLCYAWSPERFEDNPEWRKRAEKKLAEINACYEKILRAPIRSEGSRAVESAPSHSLGPEPVPSEESDEIRDRWKKIFLLASLTVVLIGAFVWPTLYERDTVKWNGKSYPFRINRITGTVTYYDGEQWKAAPDLSVAGSQSATKVAEVSPEKAPAPSEPPAATAPPAPPAEKKEGQVVASASRKSGAATSPPPERGRKTALPVHKPFSIQVRSVHDVEKARAVVEDLKTSRFDAHLAQVTLKDQGTMYRILIGHFSTKEGALLYMKNQKISEDYPNCFVQRISP